MGDMDIEPSYLPKPKKSDLFPGRLTISSIELENFKSYGGKKVIGPFHESFSAIVGPNGSGKSNVIDALLFVFGKKAKKIRLNKVSELIHSSSTIKSPSVARVIVHFVNVLDTESGAQVVPNSNITLCREAYSDNKSKYYLNGRTSTFTEITEFLAGRGIDLEHNRFLILQGEVEQIAMMKPKAPSVHEDGFLEYLEDIIGTSMYREPIQKLDEDVSKSWGIRSDAFTVFNRACDHLDEMKGKRKAAEDYFAMRRKELNLKAGLLQLHCARDEDRLTEAKRAEGEALERVKQIEEDRKKLQELTEQLEKAKSAAVQKARVAEKDSSEHQTILQRFQAEYNEAAEEKQHEKQKIANAEKTIIKSNEAICEAQKCSEENEQTLQKKKSRMAELENEERDKRDRFESFMSTLRSEERRLGEELSAAKEEMFEKGRKARDIQNQVNLNSKKFLKQQSELDAAKNLEKTKVERFKNIDDEIKDLNFQKKDLSSKLTQLKKDLNVKTNSVSQLQRDVKVQEGANRDAAGEAAHACNRRDNLQRQLLQSSGIRSRPTTTAEKVFEHLNRTLTAKEKMRLIGPIESLLSENDKKSYGQALTAFDLRALVVADSDMASKAISVAKQHSMGLLTCTIMDRIAPNVIQSSIRTDKSLPSGERRFIDVLDLIDEKYRPVLGMILRNTFLADNIEAARKITVDGSVRRHVVTMDGDEIEASGVMKGGNNVSSGKMNQKKAQVAAVTEEDVQKAIEEATAAEATASKASLALDDLASKLQGAIQIVNEIKTEMRKFDQEFGDVEARLSAIEAEAEALAVFNSNSMQRAKDFSEREKQLLGMKSALEELRVEESQARQPELLVAEQVKYIELQIRELGGPERVRLEREAKTAANELNSLQDFVKNIEKELSKVSQNIKGRQEAVTQAEDIKSKSAEKLIAIQNRLVEIESNATREVELVNKAVALFDEAKADLAKAKMEHAKGEEELKAFAEVDANRQATLEERKADTEIAKQTLAKRHKNLHRLREDFRNLPNDVDDEDEEPNDAPTSQEHSLLAIADQKETSTEQKEADRELKRNKKYIHLYPFAMHDLPREELAKSANESDLTIQIETLAMTAVTGQGESKVDVDEGWQILNEYQRRLNECKHQEKLFKVAEAEYQVQRSKLTELKSERFGRFMMGFETISVKVREMYQMLTLGGEAELELLDRSDPFETGISFSVRPPRKSWKRIDNLSGGEKTLSSLAFLFALHHYRPTPLYFLDEIDAALDFRNVAIIGNYIKTHAKGAQFITISLRHQMFELADRLVGIYKTFDVTKCILLTPGDVATDESPQNESLKTNTEVLVG